MGANFNSGPSGASPPPAGANLVARNIVEGLAGSPITPPGTNAAPPQIGAGDVPSPIASAIGGISSANTKRSLLG